MARIGIDCRFASAFGGLGRYTRELVTAMLKSEGSLHQYVLFVQNPAEEWLKEFSERHEIHAAPYQHYSLSEQLLFPFSIKKAKIDLLFVPHFNVPLFCSVPFVVTVHDLILHDFPNQASFIRRSAYRIQMSFALKRARKIIAVSNFTSQEILKHYPEVGHTRLTVITEGVNEKFTRSSETTIESVRKKYDLEKPFFLYVGNNKQHKNVSVLMEAYTNLQTASNELILITGGKEANVLREGNGIRILRNVDEGDLPALYSAACALVTASLYEGFCLPVVEAQACHTPVIASNRSAISEVATRTTMLIDPTVAAFAQAFRDPPQETDLVWVPPRWHDAALATHAILQAALENS